MSRPERLALTAAGSELLQRAADLAAQAENEITAGMTDRQLLELKRALAGLMEQNNWQSLLGSILRRPIYAA